jgi:hypothetical protein
MEVRSQVREGESAEQRYPRQGKSGKFAQGNAGRPVGIKRWKGSKIAILAREYLDDHADEVILKLLTGKAPAEVRLRTIQWLTDRADGKAPQVIRHGMDPDSPEGILLSMMGQSLPGKTSDTEDSTSDEPKEE